MMDSGGVRLVSADLDHIAYRTACCLLDVAILYRVFPRCRIIRFILSSVADATTPSEVGDPALVLSCYRICSGSAEAGIVTRIWHGQGKGVSFT